MGSGHRVTENITQSQAYKLRCMPPQCRDLQVETKRKQCNIVPSNLNIVNLHFTYS